MGVGVLGNILRSPKLGNFPGPVSAGPLLHALSEPSSGYVAEWRPRNCDFCHCEEHKLMDPGTWEVGDVTAEVAAHHVGEEVSAPALPGATWLELAGCHLGP